MRNEFVRFLEGKAQTNDKIVVLTGDLGFSVLEPLRERLGPRFINAGIAEANMVTMAAAMAAEGFKVFTYSITPFATLRCLEQIRNDVCYHNLDVTVVGVGAGFGYGTLGGTHHSLEDLAAVWSLPNINVFCPADLHQSQLMFEAAYALKGPKYLRIGKGGEGVLKHADQLPTQPKAGVFEYSKGESLTFITTGHILDSVLKATTHIPDHSTRIQVLSVAQLKPIPSLKGLLKSKRVVVVEELYPYGGFAGEVAKQLLTEGCVIEHFSALSAPDQFAKSVGSTEYQRSTAGLDANAVLFQAHKSLGVSL